jgi:tetratricopeptide (TPR) repeat protein
MNRLSSQQRKLAYLGGMLLLLIPIIALGMPADSRSGSGGVVANLRREYDLGESDIGDIDPSSSAMSFVLLGLRGIAANVLWMQAEHQKNHKDWEGMRTTTEQIVRLQPHFTKVWDFNGWNLAYNVAAEWDDVRDRYFWVKEGGKFLMKGVDRNRRSSDLPWYVGRIYGPKIGIADEVKYFRRFFLQDPDPKFGGGVDPKWNESAEDHNLVAKLWFQRANDVEAAGNRQTIQDRSLFRSYAARSQFDYANALQKFGFSEEYDRETADRKPKDAAEREQIEERIRTRLREQTREAWKTAFEDWTQKFGQEPQKTFYANQDVEFKLEMTEEEIRDWAKTPEQIPIVRQTVDQFQKITNYRYWRMRGLAESEPDTAEAHWQLFAAIEEYRKQNLDKAQTYAENAMNLFQKVLERYPNLAIEDDLVESCCQGIMIWQNVHKLNAEPIPETFPLKPIWDDAQPRLQDYRDRFDRMLRP